MLDEWSDSFLDVSTLDKSDGSLADLIVGRLDGVVLGWHYAGIVIRVKKKRQKILYLYDMKRRSDILCYRERGDRLSEEVSLPYSRVEN